MIDIFFCLDWKKSERKENEIILNDIYTLIIALYLIMSYHISKSI